MLPAATNCLTCTAGNTPVMPDFTRCPWRLHVAIRMGDAWKQDSVFEGKSRCGKCKNQVQKVHFTQSQKLNDKSLQLRVAHLFRWKYRFSMHSPSTLIHLSNPGMSLNIPSRKKSGSCINSHSWSHFYFPTTLYLQPPHCRFSSMLENCAPLNKSRIDIHGDDCTCQHDRHKHNTSGRNETGKPASYDWRPIHWGNTWKVTDSTTVGKQKWLHLDSCKCNSLPSTTMEFLN